jgi:hypothetical protein
LPSKIAVNHRSRKLVQEKPWRPADYWPQSIYVPPQTKVNWAFEATADRGSAEHGAASLGSQRRSRSPHTLATWNTSMLVFTFGLVAGIVATVLAVFVMHLA